MSSDTAAKPATSVQQPSSTPVQQKAQQAPASTRPGHLAPAHSLQFKKALGAEPFDVQMELLAPVQKKGEDTGAVHEAAAAGIASGGGKLPHADKIQQSFGGFDVGGIQAHTGAAATQANKAMGAEAYATGNHVAFAGNADLHTAAHEAAHVVQQQHGVALSGGVGQVGDKYEQHADKVADAVVSGKSAEGLLGEMTGGAKEGVQKREAVQRSAGDVVQRAPGGPPGSLSSGAPAAHPRQADIDADKAAIKDVSDLGQYKALISTLRVAPSPGSKASVALRIGKLEAAIPATEAALNRYYGALGPAKIKEYITDRKAIIDANLNSYKGAATAALSAIETSGTVNATDQFDATTPMKAWGAIKPEETTTLQTIRDVTKGVIKVFDAWSVWDAMDPAFQAGWNTHGGGKAGFVNECKAAGRLLVAPAGKETLPPFAGKGAGDAFKQTVRGFVGMGTDAAVPTGFAHALTHFALNASYYPSGVMFLGHATVAFLETLVGDLPIGKPSIFYLLVFDENTYDPNDRTFGHLADPADPTKPGPARELQCSGLPQSEFLSSGKVLS